MISLPRDVNLDDLLEFLRNIGLKSSSMLRNFEKDLVPLYSLSSNLHSNLKHNDPVTEADLTLNKFILNEFSERYPNAEWDIISEENSKLISYEVSKSDWKWFIDPLDGTRDFIQNTGEYAVHIGLLFENKPILSLVLLPSLKEMWFGVNGIGTWKESEKYNLHKKKVYFEKKKFKNYSKNSLIRVLTSKNHNNPKLDLVLKEMNFQNIIRMGSIGYKLCTLLRGDADVYISISGKTSPKDWDLAAPHALIKSANCNFTYVSGEEINYDNINYEQKGCLIASTLPNNVHKDICYEIKCILKKYNL